MIYTLYLFKISRSSQTRFFISNNFISNARLKWTKDQANFKQHPEAELLIFENYPFFSTLSFENSRAYSKK